MNPDHGYLRMIMRLVAVGKLRPGDVVHVEVCHEERCPFLAGGVCTCDPEIAVWPQAGEHLGDVTADQRVN